MNAETMALASSAFAAAALAAAEAASPAASLAFAGASTAPSAFASASLCLFGNAAVNTQGNKWAPLGKGETSS